MVTFYLLKKILFWFLSKFLRQDYSINIFGWVKSFAIFWYMLVFRLNSRNLWCLNWWHSQQIVLISLELLLVPIHGSLPVFVMLHQPRGGLNFSERVIHLERQELVSVWDQRTGRYVTSDSTTWWLLLWMLSCLCYKLKNKANNWPKYCKTFDSPEYIDLFQPVSLSLLI